MSMKSGLPARSSILGDLRAEFDKEMLESAFYESPDFRTLLESTDRTVIVGRRGTGKSALFLRLKRHWEKAQHTNVISIAPEDYEAIALKGVLRPFASRPNLIRAAAKIGWKYALYMEIGEALRGHFKFDEIVGNGNLTAHLKEWRKKAVPVSVKLRMTLQPFLNDHDKPELLVGDLAQRLNINVLFNELGACLDILHQSVYVLIDRLDEGYESDDLSIGLIDGFLHASIELNKALPYTKSLMFMRDNIFRTIAKHDADYTRQIEGQVIRLHWDEYHLFNLIINRFRVAFRSKEESSLSVWNAFTSRSLEGRNGFRECLRLTLYRPRDLLLLLNNAFFHAFQHDRDTIVEDDTNASAQEISERRYQDLITEYMTVFPGLDRLTRAFVETSATWKASELSSLLLNVFSAVDLKAEEAQQFAILGSPESATHALYSVGFLGVKDITTDRYQFCHDGSQSKLTISSDSHLLVHPCYWRALNLKPCEMTQDEAEQMPSNIIEIRDEYDIDVTSKTPEIRNHRIGQIISAFSLIPTGNDGASRFEQWCHDAISVIFAAGLTNIQLKPNEQATQRRDIVARNNGTTPVWERVLRDYRSRQVIFEVKNYVDIGPQEYRQMQGYLCREYGSLGFIITRDGDESLRKDKELPWVREMYYSHQVLIVKLTAAWIANYLSKARSPQKHDAAHVALSGLLDRYSRLYLSLGSRSAQKK